MPKGSFQITQITPKITPSAGAKKSNLAWALRCLPHDRRHAALVFYDFCRAIDDIADDPTLPAQEKQCLLDQFKLRLETNHKSSFAKAMADNDAETQRSDHSALALEEIIDIYQINPNLLLEIIQGVEMDITPRRYETFDDLLAYCWRVASAVGLVSIKIFGCQHPDSTLYAEQLGYALQLTNILRDVGEDASLGRIYLPLEDLARFHVSDTSILQKKPNGNFIELMTFEADRATHFFQQAQAHLPPSDATALRSAQTMHRIYEKLLKRMRKDRFRVFQKRYRLNKFQKLLIAATVAWASR